MVNYAIKDKDRNPDKIWDAGLYLRLSRDDDKYESESISSQREILKRFVEQNKDIRVYSTYIDDGFTGTNFDRPEFRRMENDLRTKKINCIIVKDLSRFARNCSQIGNYLSVVFPYLRTRFICINDQVDSYLDPESLENLSTKVKNLMNEEYCHDISVKCKSALTIRREAGEYIGSFPCFGYVKDPADYHRLVIDEFPAAIVRSIYQKFLAGESIRAIVRSLNAEKILSPMGYKKQKYPKYHSGYTHSETVWTQKTVRRILTNQMYVGDMVQNVMNNISYRVQRCRAVEKENWIIVPNTHEPIISRSDFQKAAELLQRDTRESSVTLQLGVLSGFIKCGDCRRGMILKTLDNGYKTYRYFICSTYKNRGKNLCTKHTILADKVENALLEFLKLNIATAVEIEPILALINRSPAKIRGSEHLQKLRDAQTAERARILRLREELYPDYKAGLIDYREYEDFRSRYEVQLREIEERIQATEEKINEMKDGITPENSFISEFKKYKNIKTLTREIVCALVENVFVFEGNRIEILLKYRDEFEAIKEYLQCNRFLLASFDLPQNNAVRAGMLPAAEGDI